MFAGGQEEQIRSNDWQAARESGEVRSGGWPLGLQQALMRRGIPEASNFFISTPSVTSDDSSDLDTESTGSFFPEKSHTLGALIGIQSNAPTSNEHSRALAEAPFLAPADQKERRKSISSSSVGRSRAAPSWCPMLGCGRSGGAANAEALGMSPSLAHLLEEERRATGPSQRQSISRNQEEERQQDRGEVGESEGVLGLGTPSLMLHSNTLFDEQGILPPRPSGAPLKLVLQHPSPSSSYLSADWNVFNSRNPHQMNDGAGGGGGSGASNHARFPTFWPALCGRLAPWLPG